MDGRRREFGGRETRRDAGGGAWPLRTWGRCARRPGPRFNVELLLGLLLIHQFPSALGVG